MHTRSTSCASARSAPSALTATSSYALGYRGRAGCDARSGGLFDVAIGAGPVALRLTYWGEERPRTFVICVDGTTIAAPRLDSSRPGTFFDVDYSLPRALTAGKAKVSVRIEPEAGSAAGPLFGCRVVALDASAPASA